MAALRHHITVSPFLFYALVSAVLPRLLTAMILLNLLRRLIPTEVLASITRIRQRPSL